MVKLTIEGMKLVYERLGESGLPWVNNEIREWDGRNIVLSIWPDKGLVSLTTDIWKEYQYPTVERITLTRGIHYKEGDNG